MLSALLFSALGCRSDEPPAPIGDTPVGFELTPGPVVSCPDPLPAPVYDEVGAAWGLEGSRVAVHYDEGGAVAAVDLDLDGDLDLVMGWADDSPTVYWRDGEGYVPERLVGIPRAVAVNVADVDGDGWPDLLLGTNGPPELVMNRRGALGPGELPEWLHQNRAKEFTPADIDGDGDVDLYAVVRGGGDDISKKEDAVLWNDGAGRFHVDAEAVPEALRFRHGFDAGFFDWDADGDPDLYVSNDLGGSYGGDFLLENREGALYDAREDCACEVVHAGMGVDHGDFNGDGLPDIYTSDWSFNRLLQALDDGSYVDVSRSLGADLQDDPIYMTWGAIFADRDNDGDVDILAARGDYAWEVPEDTSLPALLDQADGRFAEVALDGAAPGVFRSVVALDHNGDGVLDLLFTDVVERPRLYLSRGCTADAWLAVEGPPGSRVEVDAGGSTRVGWIRTDASQAAAQAPVAHFGLGEHDVVDAVRLIPPWGREVLSLEGPLDARRVIRAPPWGM